VGPQVYPPFAGEGLIDEPRRQLDTADRRQQTIIVFLMSCAVKHFS